MSFSPALTTFDGYEFQVFWTNENKVPGVVVAVARTDEQLRGIVNDLMEIETPGPSFGDVAPELKDGVPEGKMAIFLMVHQAPWQPIVNDIELESGAGRMKIKFLHTETERDRLYYFIADREEFSLRINAEFLDPYMDGPTAYMQSPHQRHTPRGLAN